MGVSRKVERKPTILANTFKRIVECVREGEREREREIEKATLSRVFHVNTLSETNYLPLSHVPIISSYCETGSA